MDAFETTCFLCLYTMIVSTASEGHVYQRQCTAPEVVAEIAVLHSLDIAFLCSLVQSQSTGLQSVLDISMWLCWPA